MESKKVILLEFNELTSSLMDEFINEGHLPNFSKLRSQSQVYTTDANTSGEDLNPWIQWVTVHTGLTPKEHGIFLLNEMQNFNGDFIWDTLSNKNISSWICGSMNTKHKDNFAGDFIPDPWATNAPPFPPEKFDTYFNFISQSVHGHSSNKTVPALAFVKYMLTNGLSLSTMFKMSKQILSELKNKNLSWKRALILDWIQFDLFKSYYQKEQPKFATFFSNSTAHYQHHYWRDMDPTLFGVPANKVDKTKKNAILTAYKNMDEMLGKVFSMLDDSTVIAFVTALSQKPYLESQRYYYHINNFDVFLEKLKITQVVKYKPIMAEQFHLECQSEEEAIKLLKHLESFDMDSNKYFHVGTNQVLLVTREGINVHVQCRCTKETSPAAKIINKMDNTELDFSDIFYEMDELKTGMHDPHGMFWVYDRNLTPKVYDVPIPLENTHKIILDMYN